MRILGFAAALSMACVLSGSWLAHAQTAAAPPPGSLPDTIAIFPLDDVMLFPNVNRPLHIFEPRYRAMVADALQGDRLIGMVLLEPGHEADYEGRPPVFAVGCAGYIDSVRMYPDGRYDIVLRGLSKFRITTEDHSRPYRVATVEVIPELVGDDERVALAERRARIVAAYLAAAPNAEAPPPELGNEGLVNGLAQFLGFAPLDRQQLLEADGPLARADVLLSLLEDSPDTPQTVR